ncbi:diguanylate cyclase with GAF sensor [Methylocaldum marinum]|uniref:diguanylate cyclase n=1 Tax=Methylocaldum marinum TaxID=1432792 RepID=A0A250L0F3_9GAMM|nr:sensor domain-containing diguanylate cyclase [Methylocaldum marinum]BBA37224.1 diguanylate cyclase with GAF sensor [Methylocaldum marinum]
MDELYTDLCVLQSHLDNLVDSIRLNQIKLHRFQTLEMNLLTLNSLRELVDQVLEDTRLLFELDAVSFVLVDEKGELKRFLIEDGLRVEKQPNLILLSSGDLLDRTFRKHLRPYLGNYKVEKCGAFFPGPPAPSSSVALLPLYRRGKLMGSLNLASTDKTRFCEQMATDFLDRLACVLSVCLENTLNFELIRRTSLIDMLTGVNNRRYFEQRVGEEIDRTRRTGECLSCLFLDIDHFKTINDTYGHQSGDRVLVDAAQTIRSTLRDSDVLARYGGEEFVVLLSAGTGDRAAADVAERIRQCIADHEFYDKNSQALQISLSIGVATLDPSRIDGIDATVERLIEAADRALYLAKNNGRNRVVSGFVEPSIQKAPQQYVAGF